MSPFPFSIFFSFFPLVKPLNEKILRLLDIFRPKSICTATFGFLGVQEIHIFKSSVADPFHFYMDPDLDPDPAPNPT